MQTKLIENQNEQKLYEIIKDKHLQHIHPQRPFPSWAAHPAARHFARRAHARPLPAECTPQARHL